MPGMDLLLACGWASFGVFALLTSAAVYSSLSKQESTLEQSRGTLISTTRARNQAGGKPCLFGHGINMEVFG
jgi:hypothetical protein